MRLYAWLSSLCLAVACAAGPHPEPATPSIAAQGGPRAPSLRVTPWPEGAASFRTNGPWLGADSAYSVDLHDGRVLWLFGDTFIDPARDGSRTNGPNVFVRNTVALQTRATSDAAATGYDLSRSELQFFTGPERAGAATSFFPEAPNGDWFWPLHGIRIERGPLLLFRMRVSKVDTGFGFKVTGWDAVAIDNADASPDAWTLRTVAGQPADAERLFGASVMLHGDYLYAYAVKNSDDDHALYVARIALTELRELSSAAFADPEWFTARGFQRLSTGAEPEVILPGGQIEHSVHFESRLGLFVQIQTRGLFASDPQTAIVMRTSTAPEGPWSEPVAVWKPETPHGADPTKVLTYAAKAHPEQRGSTNGASDLIVTYMQNDAGHPVPIDALYYPELLRLRWE